MGLSRRERKHAATREEIKEIARAHMARDGAAALSLRAVAAEMELSPAALYYYFPNRDALITALIVDAFRSLAEALDAARDSRRDADIAEQLLAMMLAYRAWALGHAAEFALIFGTPIPGYQAPPDVTAPEARRALSSIGGVFGAARASGRLRFPPADGPAPPALGERIRGWSAATGIEVAPEVIHATLHAQAVGQGLVSLELYGHLQPVIGDPSDLYHYEVRELLRRLIAPAT
jgi:AcrR family transcriptional regulator